jgi:hypothetical protein
LPTRLRPRAVAPEHPRVYDPRFDDTRELTQLAHWAASEHDSAFTWFEPPELEAADRAADRVVPGMIVDGTAIEATAIEATAINGTAIEATAINGTAIEATAISGTAMNGTVLDAPVADDARAALPVAPVSAVPEKTAQEKTAPENPASGNPEPENPEPSDLVPATPALPAAPVPNRGGLTRRQPGGHLPKFGADQPCIERSRTDQPTTPERAPAIRGELTRRVPGTHLDRSLRTDHVSPQLATYGTQPRDPAAERAELESFVAGVARATGAASDARANQ